MEPLALIGYFLFAALFFIRPIRRFALGICVLVVAIGAVMMADGNNEHAPMMTGLFGVVGGALLVAELIAGAIRRRSEDDRMQRNIAAARRR